jgi:micrococcal nuclease
MKRRIRYVVSFIALGLTFLVINFSKQINLTHQSYDKFPYQYTVRHVIDGDTVELSNGDMVRYIGIDTPEMRERKGSEWIYNPMPYAEKAKEFNKILVEGKSVRLEYDVQKKDKYNRILAYVYTGDKMVNAEIVREGLAMIYTYPPNVRYVEKFLEAQKEARDNKKGLWLGLEENKISALEAKNNIGKIRIVESEVISTYLTEKILILKCKNNFKIVLYKNNIPPDMKDMARSPNKYFKGKTVRVYGIIKKYKGYPEIVVHDMSQLEILKNY